MTLCRTPNKVQWKAEEALGTTDRLAVHSIVVAMRNVHTPYCVYQGWMIPDFFFDRYRYQNPQKISINTDTDIIEIKIKTPDTRY